MRSIELLWRATIKVLAIAFLDLTLARDSMGARRPQYGGTLRVELQTASVSLDPREWKLGTLEFAINEKLAALVFDRLVTLDNYGRFQPQLAAEWSHDAGFRRWQFVLRANVKFSDGTTMNSTDVVASLQPLLPGGQQISASGNNFVIQSSEPIPDLLEELASGRFFVYRVQPDGKLVGTGPFLAAGFQFVSNNEEIATVPEKEPTTERASRNRASKLTRMRFRANEATWPGRPFLDAIEITLGVSPLRQLFDLQLGQADLVDLAPDLVRRAMQDNQRVWSSAPLILYGLTFDTSQRATGDTKLREAVSLSLDRQTMANVLLQKQAEPASSLLPQWLSGYAFLFPMETNTERAKEIRAMLPANAGAATEPLRLRVDAFGDLAKLLAQRVAVNTRQAAIPVQLANQPAPQPASASTAAASDSAAGLHLFAWHYSSLSPRVELEAFVSALHLETLSDNLTYSTDPEQLYARERKLLEDRQILPLVALPEYVGLGPNVRDWIPARWGDWHLSDVWLDLPVSSSAQPGDSNGAVNLSPRLQPGSRGGRP